MKLSVATYERGPSTCSVGWGGVGWSGGSFPSKQHAPHTKKRIFSPNAFISLVIGMEQAQTSETKEGGLNVWKETSRPLQWVLLNAPSVKQEVVISPVNTRGV